MFKNKIFNSSYFFRFVLSANVLFVSSSVFSEDLMTDSVHRRKLREVVVSGQQLQAARSAMPVQIRSQKDFLLVNATNVADVANSFSGVTLKDYGGIGGMKTVAVRGMDAHYTGVSYDGIMMSDIQSGQIDLGRFPVDNIAEISLVNGQPADIFQSARLYACGSVLCLKTQMPENNAKNELSGKVSLKAGSFGLLNPGLLLMKNFGKKWAVNASADALTAHGRYSFVQHYGPSQNNVSEILKRTNTDVRSLRSEVNGLYRVSNKESFFLKTNLFLSERGLPGGVTFYNQDPSQQRLADRTLFTQLHYLNRNSSRFSYQFFTRFSSAYGHYTDHDAEYSQSNGLLSDKYLQNEYYLSASALYKLSETLQVTGATDWWYNTLDINSNINFEDFQYPTRHTSMSNVALKYFTNRLTLGANLLYTLTREGVRSGVVSPDRDKFSPTVNLSYQLFDDKEYRVRAFYKNIYRLPTFNDLYYQDMGNPHLRPENAHLCNVGITCVENNLPLLSFLEVTADAYFNKVADKIIAIPVDGYHWSMTNRGRVNIIGLDMNLKAEYKLPKDDLLKFRSNYSYQNAKDATIGSDNYGEQIPYIPMHFGSASLSYQHGRWETGYNLIFSGIRWIGQMTDPRNKMKPYATHSVFVSTSYKRWQLNAELLNLLNTQYEIVRFYPMPRRNYRITLIMKI